MKLRFIRLTAACLLFVLALSLTACGDKESTVKVESFSTEPITVTTVAPAERVTLSLNTLYATMAPTVRWSELSGFIFTETGDGKAEFVVEHNDKTLLLQVEYDKDSDSVSVADLTYGDTTVSILTDDRTVMRTVLTALTEG